MITESMEHVLYLHGRGEEPESPPGDLVHSSFWPRLEAPWLDPQWLTQPFERQIELVDRWMGHGAVLCVGHSWGAYLLLAASLQRIERGETFAPMVLLSSVLGMVASQGQDGKTIGFIAPRARRVRSALGLDNGDAGSEPLKGLVTFVHGQEDPQSPVEEIRKVQARGFDVRIVPASHRLDTPDARSAVTQALGKYRLNGKPAE